MSLTFPVKEIGNVYRDEILKRHLRNYRRMRQKMKESIVKHRELWKE